MDMCDVIILLSVNVLLYKQAVGRLQYARCKWWLEQRARAFSLEATAHVCDAGHRTTSLYQV